jgi:uncharacterized protein DUF6487
MQEGYVATSNGSGLFWTSESQPERLRPVGLEVLAPTGFMGTFSANLPAQRCTNCRKVTFRTP